MTVDLIIWAVILAAIGFACWRLYLFGRNSAEADVMEQINDDALKATKIREEVDLMSSSDVRDALKLRRAK